MSAPSSAIVLARAKAGDREALGALLEDVAPAIQRFGLKMCRNGADADEVVQDTLLSITTHLAAFEGRSSFLSWVFALTRSACARKRRGLKNQPHVPEEAAPEQAAEDPNPERLAEQAELRETLARALGSLTEDHREVLLLRDVEGLSAPETAAALGLTVEATKSRLHRAREALRAALAPALEPAQDGPLPGCPDIVALWSAKLEGDLDDGTCLAMEEHLRTCPRCSSACGALKTALGACRAATTPADRDRLRPLVAAALATWASEAEKRPGPR